MSAIAGVVPLKSSDNVPQQLILSMLDAMKPTVPASTETYALPHAIGFVGILAYGPKDSSSVAGGNGPEEPQAFCAGEFYNDDLAPSQTAAAFLLQRYLQLGAEGFAVGLNGSFCAVLADPCERSVMLVSDHAASFPLFVATANDRVYFASEVKELLTVPELYGGPNPSAVLAYACSGCFLHRCTLVTGLQRMSYATVLRVHKGTMRTQRYWRYDVEPDHRPAFRELQSQCADLLRQAVQRRLRRGRVSILLSGGVDSRGILACATDPSRIPAVTYTGWKRETRHALGDWAIAERVAKSLNLDLSVVRFDPQQYMTAMEDSVVGSDGAAGFVFENVWDHVREQTGTEYLLAGDECMGWTIGVMSQARVLPVLGIHSLADLPSVQQCLRADQRKSFLEQSKADMNVILSASSARNPHDRVDELYFRQRLINMLHPKRRVIARHGLRVRNPWLDLDVLNFVRTLPPRYRIRKMLYRNTISRLNPELFRIPRAQAGETVDYRADLTRAERESRALTDLLLGEHSPAEQFFDREAVSRLIQAECYQESAAKTSHRFRLATLLPVTVRHQLASVLMRITNPPFTLSRTVLLLRIMAMTMGLGYHRTFHRE
ncbi:MAG: hypothetical protein JXB13_13780 [Phycisphaerae bacterium]|nr:hypothetical protein [Phycisphaerae bacterium]